MNTELDRILIALQTVDVFFQTVSELGWFDKMAADIHPDRINEVCDMVRDSLQIGLKLRNNGASRP